MAPKVNSLTYLCLDKIMEITQNIRTMPCQDSLQWISSAWSYIHKTPLLYQSYSNILLSNSRLSLQQSISTLSCHLPITYYEKNELLYTCLDQRYYASLKKNVFLMNHLSNGVTHLHLKKCHYQPQHFATVPIKTFLKNCMSVNAVTFCENRISSDQYFRIQLKVLQEIVLTDDEFKLCHPVGKESLILDCLTVCPKIEIIENLQIDCVELFCKYILGLNINMCIKNNEIHDIKNILRWSKPSWPKLKSIHMPLNCYEHRYTHVHNLCFLILKNFQNAFPKESNSKLLSQPHLEQIFESTEKVMAVKLLRNKFEFVSSDYYDFYHREGLLSNVYTVIELDMTSAELDDCLKILKAHQNVLDKRIQINVSNFVGKGLLSNYEKLFDVEEYPSILKNIAHVHIFCNSGIEHAILEAVTNIVDAASNLQVLKLDFFKTFIIPNILSQCLTPLPSLCIKTNVLELYHKYIEFCMTLFPYVQHVSLILLNCLDNISITNGSFEYVKKLNNLKSFHVNLNNFTIDTEHLLLFLYQISLNLDKKVKLYYSVNSRHLHTKVLLILRNRGWHFYRK